MQSFEEKQRVDLMSRMIPELKNSFLTGERKSRFNELSIRIKNGEITDETVLPFINQLKIDAEEFISNRPVSECAFVAPRRGSKNKEKLDPYIQLLFPYEDKVKSIIRYQKTISLFTTVFKEQEYTEYKKKFGYKPDYWTNHDESSIPEMVVRPFAREITEPKAMPIEHTPADELKPIIDYLKANKKPFDGYDQLNWCTVYSDGRFDSCKQGTGQSIKAITEALVNNDKIKHFLYGNNIMGAEGCRSIKELLLNYNSISKIKTWYLAGNDIDAEGMKLLAEGLYDNNDVKELWLKRNPIKAEGAEYLAKLFENNTSIETLDLDNTGLMDEGLNTLMKGLMYNDTLRNLYIDANGLTNATSLIIYFSCLIADDKHGIDSLWLGINRIVDNQIIPLVYILGKYKHLKRLCLGSNMLTSESARAIYFAFKDHPNLEVLDLGKYKSTTDMGEISNILRDEGAFWIAKLIRENQNLRYVNMSYNGLTDVGVRYLIDALDVNSREWIDYNFHKHIEEASEFELGEELYDNNDEKAFSAKIKSSSSYVLLFNGRPIIKKNDKVKRPIIILEKECRDLFFQDGPFCDTQIFDIGNPAPKLMFLQIDERIPINGDKLDVIMKERRLKANENDSNIRFIKHGPTIENIDSIYRNNSK